MKTSKTGPILYRNSLDLAFDTGGKKIAFPSITNGDFGGVQYPFIDATVRCLH
jgi:hypothetical protein